MKTSIVLAITFRCLIYFELNFVYGVKKGSKVVPAPLVEKTVLSPLEFLGAFVKIQLTINVSFFQQYSIVFRVFYISFVKFTPKYFTPFDTTVNEFVFLISTCFIASV